MSHELPGELTVVFLCVLEERDLIRLSVLLIGQGFQFLKQFNIGCKVIILDIDYLDYKRTAEKGLGRRRMKKMV